MEQVYLKDRRKLAFFGPAPDADYWSNHWQSDHLEKHVRSGATESFFVPTIRKWIPDQTGKRIIDGGCGRGQFVFALKNLGYESFGIDFAEPALQATHRLFPDLSMTAGDVFSLPYKGDAFDGYLSVGVIEHFFEGYEEILVEISRVVKPGGFLFISFPCVSLLRRAKVLLNIYPNQKTSSDDAFYQYALDEKDVIDDIMNFEFALKSKTHFDGIKGFKDEVSLFRRSLQKLYDTDNHPVIKMILDRIFRLFAPHCTMLIFQKQ